MYIYKLHVLHTVVKLPYLTNPKKFLYKTDHTKLYEYMMQKKEFKHPKGKRRCKDI